MRIALRTSGGRGEYELAGSQGTIPASRLFNKELEYEITPDIVIPGGAIAKRLPTQGKPRIRLHDQHSYTHLYRLLAAILLLPRPKRELGKTGAGEILKRDAYSITDIKVDLAQEGERSAILRPTDLVLQNASQAGQTIVFAERMARISQLWQEAETHDTPLAQLVREHRSAVESVNPNHKDIEKKAELITESLNTETDPLPEIEALFGISDHSAIAAATQSVIPMIDQDPVTPDQARLERVKQWRQVMLRGVAGQQFRTSVTEAYDYRCFFTGQRLPKTSVTASSGVDAAHILPWSSHNINSPSNGICLNKLCHWALDAGVLKLSFTNHKYVIEVPDRVRSVAGAERIDLGYFERIAGEVPADRLPKNPAFWPSPKYISDLNAFMFGRG